MNAASAGAACGLCRARRRTTNAVQSNICMLTIQILRRSAPQNDKLLNCSQTPRQTGICNWRQRRKDGGKRCSGRPQLTELNTGFSRASRSPATRRLAKLAPRASAREQLLYLCQNRDRLRLAQRCAPETTVSLHKPPAPLRRQRTAESTTSLTKAVTLVTPGGVADRPDAPGHLRGSKRKPLPEIDRAAVFGFCLRPNSQSALISCSTLLVLRTASAEAANLAASSFVRSIFTIFSIPLRPMIAGTPMQMSSWPYSPSR